MDSPGYRTIGSIGVRMDGQRYFPPITSCCLLDTMNLESELLSRLNMTDAGTGGASRADMQICTCKA